VLNGEDLSCYSKIKLNQLVQQKDTRTITELPTKRIKRYHSDEHFSEFLPTIWRQNSTSIDMEQKYVTVTPC